MDLSAFSNQNYDANEWVNSTFQCQEAEIDTKAFVSSLILKLQLFIQEVNNSLEDTAQQVLQNLPRVTREVEAMRQEAALLQDQMRTIKQEVVKVERDSAKSMHTLLKIDSVKSRMQDATDALKEADNWSTLSTDVEDFFQKGDIDKIASKLIRMQNSLEILIDVPDYEDRCKRLEKLKNRLEAILSPNVITAFNAQSMEAAILYSKIFRDIKRMPQLLKYYCKCQKTQLQQTWRQIVEADPDETFHDHLTNFYDLLLSVWHAQINWTSQVFVDVTPLVVLADLFVDVLTGLEPSLPFCLEAALKLQTSPLIFLIELKQVTDRFARSLDLAIQSLGPSTPDKSAYISSLAQTIYSMYRSHIEKYQRLQERELLSRLSALKMTSDELTDSVNQMSDSVTKVFNLVCECEMQCQHFTSGCGYPSFLRALEVFYAEYMNKFRHVLKQVNQVPAVTSRNVTAIIQDWTLFQHTLNILQVLGGVLLQLESFETMIVSNIRETVKNLGFPMSIVITEEEKRLEISPFRSHDDLLLTVFTKREFKELLRKFQTGDEGILLENSNKTVHKMCSEAGQLTFNLVFNNIKAHLQKVPLMKVWTEEHSTNSLTSDLPTFSLSPQEYITEIGQYLMTLPQHIEPFVLHDNPALLKAMKHGQFPYSSTSDDSDQVADFLLGCIARGTLEVYIDCILSIQQLTNHSTKQLATDLGYLSDVLEDLGLNPSIQLQDILVLLKANPEEFQSIARSKPRRISNTIQSMRRLNYF